MSIQWLAIPTEVVDALAHDDAASLAVLRLYRHANRLHGRPFEWSARWAQQQWNMSARRALAGLDGGDFGEVRPEDAPEALAAILAHLGVCEVVRG
jgi:hypothetical protein